MTKILHNFCWFWAAFIAYFITSFGLLYGLAEFPKDVATIMSVIVCLPIAVFWALLADDYGVRKL